MSNPMEAICVLLVGFILGYVYSHLTFNSFNTPSKPKYVKKEVKCSCRDRVKVKQLFKKIDKRLIGVRPDSYFTIDVPKMSSWDSIKHTRDKIYKAAKVRNVYICPPKEGKITVIKFSPDTGALIDRIRREALVMSVTEKLQRMFTVDDCVIVDDNTKRTIMDLYGISVSETRVIDNKTLITLVMA